MSITISVDALQAARHLEVVEREARVRLEAAVEETAIDARDEWRANATRTAGEHGKHYPKSIDYRMFSNLDAQVRPRPYMKQGKMSFEEGSDNQPAHWDARLAALMIGPIFTRRAKSALTFS